MPTNQYLNLLDPLSENASGVLVSDGMLGIALEMEGPNCLCRHLPGPYGLSYKEPWVGFYTQDDVTFLHQEDFRLEIHWKPGASSRLEIDHLQSRSEEIELNLWSDEIVQAFLYLPDTGELYYKIPTREIPKSLITRKLAALYQMLPNGGVKLIGGKAGGQS